MDASTKQRIDEMLEQNRVFLFMKGSPDMPQCGFSMRAISILRALGVQFGSFDILSDDELRMAVKEYANWPTYPQLWVDKQLVGGSDIMMEMWEGGDLEKLVEGVPKAS
jgi:monothiol glutaredoxin